MSRLCRWGMHRPARHKIFNHGRVFTRCCDCGVSLVERRRGWAEAPAGMRIVWKPRPAGDTLPRRMPNPDRRRVRPSFLKLLIHGPEPLGWPACVPAVRNGGSEGGT